MQSFENNAKSEVPMIDGAWWTVATNPDLGELDGGEHQQPVDFAVWQSANRMWQLWSCIRRTKCGGKTRLLYHWQGKNLTDRDWEPMGIAMEANTKFGERVGGLQAPYVLKINNLYHMFYGCWDAISVATSEDGVTFKRKLNAEGKSIIFDHEKDSNPRDPIVIQVDSLWFCYYTAFPNRKGRDYCRTSKDLVNWSEPKVVAFGGQSGTGPGSAECPFIVHRDPYYYLFRTQHYADSPQTSAYRSKDPMYFGINDDSYFVCRLSVAAPEIILHEEQYYIAALLPNLKGIRIAKLKWVQR